MLAVVGIATLAALAVAIGTGEFDDREWKVVATVWAALLCGGAAGAGLRLILRRDLPIVGTACFLIALASFIVFAVTIWNDGLWDDHAETLFKLCVSGLALVVAALVVASLRLQLEVGHPAVRIAYYVAAALATVTALVSVGLLWAWELQFFDGDGGGEELEDSAQRLLLALFTLSVGAYLATPLLQWALPRRDERSRG